MPEDMMIANVQARCAYAIERLRLASTRSVLANASPRIIAASKQQSAQAIEAAIAAGISDFGENRVQEAQEKWPAILAKHPHVCLHFIGPLQSNKAREAVALFDVIHSVDREKIARVIHHEALSQHRSPTVLVQVNTGQEPQKAGVLPSEIEGFVALCRDHIGLAVEGLMCVPPANDAPAPHFALLHAMAKRHRLNLLSMGMSSDYEEAARFGASFVRIGTALFGARK